MFLIYSRYLDDRLFKLSFLSFLLCYYVPLISASFCDSLIEKEVESNKILPDTVRLSFNDCNGNSIRYDKNHLLKLNILNCYSNCVRTLPDYVPSDMKKKC